MGALCLKETFTKASPKPSSSAMDFLALDVAGLVQPSGDGLLRSIVVADPSPQETPHSRRPGRHGPDHLRRPVRATRPIPAFSPLGAGTSLAHHVPTAPRALSWYILTWFYEHQQPGAWEPVWALRPW